ncbi:pirin-like bicupin family protein [Paenibacillus sp. NFR01]|uniref:pirin family protein n=1 Tax=Paenibacillus sp. NFR01 TaxID=1566279 RepID=UPI0008B5AF16|nr:pirin-like bicupin family protein [Paenibacillus sp. NFR01]SEU00739.1 hypothetical protein SAMN03159358_3069 [Paenibacillus sp. NFR01]
MIERYAAEAAHRFDYGWLKGAHLFSFGDYYDPDNTAFGPMRVCNDDTIAPGKGFGAHPHSDMEIVSIVLSGTLRHEDNLGHVVETSFGGVQRMSAGTGVIHTEHNPSDDEPVRLLQLWFMPRRRGGAPSYRTGGFDPQKLDGRLLPVVAPERSEETVDIAQDLTIYLGKAQAGGRLELRQAPGRRVFVYVIEGLAGLGADEPLQPGDHARIEAPGPLTIAAIHDLFVMVIDLP